jgi:hypothetical protein
MVLADEHSPLSRRAAGHGHFKIAIQLQPNHLPSSATRLAPSSLLPSSQKEVMATPKQNDANRQNAQKSTGPRSPEGKAASRFNALKSGIDAQAQVIPGEDPDQLEVLVAEYQERFSTATPERRLLVDTLVTAEWLLRRLNRAEAEFWQYEAHRTESNYISNEHPIRRVLYHGDRVFDRLQRRIDSIGRNYHRALKELQSLEAAEQPVECPSGAGLQACPVTTPEHSDPPATEAPAPAPSQSNQQPGPQIAFVPQFAETAPQPGPVGQITHNLTKNTTGY